METKKCLICEKKLPITDFREKKFGYRESYCKPCQSKKAWDYKVSKGIVKPKIKREGFCFTEEIKDLLGYYDSYSNSY